MKATVFSAIFASMVCIAAQAVEPGHVSDSPHNVSVYGLSPPKQQAICLPCHTPHIATGIEPLWDQDERPPGKKPFTATAASARSGQPTGSSKLCLSCHDGTIAAGDIVTRGQRIATVQGITTIPRDTPMTGSDLSDDHPISFRFDSKLIATKTWLKDPKDLTETGQLDARGEMQCRSCHDPHDNSVGKFLVAPTTNSELCRTCHQMGTTTVVDHVQCMGCHQSHTAPSGARLLRQETITTTCLTCHAGGSSEPQGANVAAMLQKISNHDTNPPINLQRHQPDETACDDCHEPHTMRVGKTGAPAIRTVFGEQSGVSAMGTPIARARFEYEVCFKCHGDRHDYEPRISRAIFQSNWRLMFSRSAISFHPIEGRGVNPSVPSLLPPQTVGSLIYCTDCHGSDLSENAGRFGANGPHGSETTSLLVARYETTDYTVENANNYALCYRCHNRNSILSDQSFKKHKLHIVDKQTPCSACHDSHGISSAQGTRMHNSHLINFDIRIVQKSSAGVREYNSTGIRSGNCTLKCHGVEHINFSY